MITSERGRSLAAVVLALFALTIVLAGCGEEKQEGRQGQPGAVHDTGEEFLGEPGAVVATVAGEEISFAEVNLVARFWFEARQQQRQPPVPRNMLQRQALEHLIDQRVLAQQAAREGIQVDRAVVDSMVAAWESGFATPGEREARLLESGVTRDQVRESFERDRRVQALVMQSIVDTIRIRDAQLREYYEANPQYFDTTRVRVSHILLASQAGDEAAAPDAARAKANDLLGQLRAGADFAELARQNSDCPSQAQGGDLGYANRSRPVWVPPFHAAAFELEEGQISEVVETQFGYHILKVTERDDGLLDLDQISENLRQFLKNARVQEAVSAYAQRLRAETDIQIMM